MTFKSLNFTQSVPSTSWQIIHNFGYKPVSDVLINVNGKQEKILPSSVIQISDNEIQVNFDGPQTGSVRLM